MAGRKRANINKKTFENLCALQCTAAEIAAVFEVNKDTITQFCKREYGMNFRDAFKAFRAKGLVSLRRTQWKQARESVQMSIHLGKQYLGQSDKVESKQDVTNKIEMMTEAEKQKKLKDLLSRSKEVLEND